jgi:hypothetical protein
MISLFVLLAVAGGGIRLGLNWAVRRKFGLHLSLPPIVAMLLVLLVALPEIVSPLSIKPPLGLVLGLILPDLLVRRVW